MNETTGSPYLQQVLALEPGQSAAEMLRLRRMHLAPDDVIVAELTDESSDALRARLLNRLHRLRGEF